MDTALQQYLNDLYQSIRSGTLDPSTVLEAKILQILAAAGTEQSLSQIQDQLDINQLVSQALTRLVEASLVTQTEGGSYTVSSDGGDSEQSPTGDIAADPDELPSPDPKEQSFHRPKPSTADIDASFTPRSGSRSVRKKMRSEALKGPDSEPGSSASDDLDMDSLFDDALGESIEDFVSDFDDLIIEETKSEGGIIQPLVDLLVETNYLDASGDPENSPEYQIMELILENYPISTEEIETKTEVDSLSLMLSNLKADDLINQTNDYRYTITKKVYRALKDQIEEKGATAEIDKDRKLFMDYIDKPRLQFVNACLAMSYIDKPGQGFEVYSSVPEFEVLNMVREREPISSETIKTMVDKTLPVVVSRMLSKLHADGLVVTDMDGNYLTSTKLYYLMVRDKLEQSLGEEELEALETKYS